MVAYIIKISGRTVLFLPDLDSWAKWESDFGVRIEDMIESDDLAFIDPTFFIIMN